MDVAVSALRANLSHWLDRVREGEEVVVTDRGTPVARIVGVSAATMLDRLEREGLVARPRVPTRPRARGRARVRSKRSVAALVSDERG